MDNYFDFLTPKSLREACLFHYGTDQKRIQEEFLSSIKLSVIYVVMIVSLALIFQNLQLSYFLFFTPVLYFLRLTSLSRNFKNEMANSERYVELIMGEIQLINKTTRSIFDAIELISSGDYSLISQDLKKAIIEINKGKNPEKIIYLISQKPYSQPIKDLFLMLSRIDHETKMNKDSSLFQKYSNFTEQLQTKLTLSIALSTFLPIISFSILIIQQLGSSFFFMIIIVIIVSIMYFFDKFVLQNKIQLFGER